MVNPQVVAGLNLHVAGYIRQSYGRANGSEAGPASQRAANRRRFDQYAADVAGQDLTATWCGHYEDVGVSAYDGTARPNFEQLLEDCRKGRINVIIVYNISRLSRLEPRDAIPIVAELLSLGVTIISTAEGVFHPGDTMDLIHLIFRLDASHRESKNKGTAVRDAAALARSLGGYVGGRAPYGRRLRQEIRTAPDGKPVAVQLLDIDPGESAVIRRVWEIIKAGRANATTGKEVPGSIGYVCRILNAEGVPTQGTTRSRKGKASAWYPRTVISMLRHPHLAGFDHETVYSEKGRVSGHRIRRDTDGKPVRAWEPILAEAEWFDLQQRLDARPVQQRENGTSALLSSMGLLKCTCGFTMSASNAERAASYFCNRPPGRQAELSKPGDHTGRAYILRDGLDAYVVCRIFAQIAAAEWNPEALEILARVTAHYAEVNETPETAQERRGLLHERADALQALRQLYDDRALYQGDEVGCGRWATDVRAQQDRVKAADARLETLGHAGSTVLPIAEWLDSDTGDPMGPGSWWDGATLEQRRGFVALWCRKITVRKARPDEKHRGNKAPAVIGPRVTIEWR